MPEGSRKIFRSLLTAGLGVALGTLLGRASGFVREVFIASNFAASHQADLAVLVLTVPDFLIALITGEALGMVLIPEFKQLAAGESWGAFVRFFWMVGVGACALSLVLFIFPISLVDIFAPGLSNESHPQAVDLFKTVIWVLPLTMLASVTTAYLQAQHRFWLPALGNLFFNISLILCLLGIFGPAKLTLLPLAVLIGGGLRLFTQLIHVFSIQVKPRFVGSYRPDRWVIFRYLNALAAGVMLVFLYIAARRYASYGPVGSLALYNYASKLVELPVGGGLIVFSTVLFPKLSEYFVSSETHREGFEIARAALKLMALASVILAVILMILCLYLSQKNLSWRGLTPAQLNQIFRMAAIGLCGLPAQGLTYITTAILNARRDIGILLYSGLLALVVFFPIGWSLQQSLGLTGIFLSLVIVFYLNLALHLISLKRRYSFDLFAKSTVSAKIER